MVTYLNFITFIVGSHRQSDVICFQLRSAFDRTPNALLLQRFGASGFSGGYVNWLRSYLTNQQHQVRTSWIQSPLEVFSDDLQGSVLWPLLFSVSVNDFAMQLTTLATFVLLMISKSTVSLNLQKIIIYYSLTLVNSIQGWCNAKYMKLSIKSKYILLKKI